VQRVLIGLAAQPRRRPTVWPFHHVAKCAICGGNLRRQTTTAQARRRP